jgi:hypothetical protein
MKLTKFDKNNPFLSKWKFFKKENFLFFTIFFFLVLVYILALYFLFCVYNGNYTRALVGSLWVCVYLVHFKLLQSPYVCTCSALKKPSKSLEEDFYPLFVVLKTALSFLLKLCLLLGGFFAWTFSIEILGWEVWVAYTFTLGYSFLFLGVIHFTKLLQALKALFHIVKLMFSEKKKKKLFLHKA